MAKKDTYLALLRRGIDETTAMQLADAGIKIGDLKKVDKTQLVENYGLKPDIAEGVLEIISAGPQSHGKERYLSRSLRRSASKRTRSRNSNSSASRRMFFLSWPSKKERLKLAKVEAFRSKKLVMNRLGKTVELIVKLENNLDDEGKDDQKVKIRDQLETRGLEAARDHEMLELEGTPQDIVDFRRKIVPKLILHACPECNEEMDPRSSRNPDDPENWSFICWECETVFQPGLVDVVDTIMENGGRVSIDPDARPRNPVPPKPAVQDFTAINELVKAELAQTGADADSIAEAAEQSALTSGLMSIDDWIDQTLAAKGYIQAQEDREDFILRTGAGATKFNKWMKKAGLYFNKQTGRWSRWEDR